jgi:protease-4
MPAKTLIAEQTTLTGSIGVYAALPNLAELGDKIGFRMEIIRAGQVKDSGSPFKKMTEHERQLWQVMIDHSYVQFLHVVESGRPQLKGKLQEDIVTETPGPVRAEDKLPRQITRYRADGGIFTADEAKKFGLIDQIGYLEDAVKATAQAAGLGENYKVVEYERPRTLLGLLGVKSPAPERGWQPAQLAAAATPRLWYLAPQTELAGVFFAAGQD